MSCLSNTVSQQTQPNIHFNLHHVLSMMKWTKYTSWTSPLSPLRITSPLKLEGQAANDVCSYSAQKPTNHFKQHKSLADFFPHEVNSTLARNQYLENFVLLCVKAIHFSLIKKNVMNIFTCYVNISTVCVCLLCCRYITNIVNFLRFPLQINLTKP